MSEQPDTYRKDLTLGQRIINVQHLLKAPKNQRNDFAKFNYRSAEDILEALKPLLHRFGLLQTISDNIEVFGSASVTDDEGKTQTGDRVYVTATVRVGLAEGGEGAESYCEVRASARESLTKKGMDSAQITGAASSYARKYALCGMWNIDDGNDMDSKDNRSNRK